MEAKNRIESIDRLRGVAIILVVLAHILRTGEDGILYVIINAFHVPLFMFLSGVIISEPPSFSKLLKKFSLYLCPFFVVGILYTLFISDSISDFLFANKKNGYWYLLVLVFFYSFIYLYSLLGKRCLIKDIILIVVTYALLFIGSHYLPYHLANLFSLPGCHQSFPFFALGYLFNRYRVWGVLMNNKKATMLLWISLLCVIPLMYIYIKYKHLYILEASCVIFILFFLFLYREKKTTFTENQLSYIGRETLDIYIYHYFIIRNLSLGSFNCLLEEKGLVFVEFIFNLLLSIAIVFIAIYVGKVIRMIKPLKYLVYGVK